MDIQGMTNEQIRDAFVGGKLVFECMDTSGDKKSMWDPTVNLEVEEARREFEKYTKEHKYKAFRVNASGEKGEPMMAFEPGAGRVIFVPPLQGG